MNKSNRKCIVFMMYSQRYGSIEEGPHIGPRNIPYPAYAELRLPRRWNPTSANPLATMTGSPGSGTVAAFE